MQTALDRLKELYPDSSTSTLRKWLKNKRVYLNGSLLQKASEPIGPDDLIEVGNKKTFFKEDIEILYEDHDVVVIYKPVKLLSVATDQEVERTAHDLLKTRYTKKRVFPVHRLDYETSGVMVFALSKSAKEALKEQFKEHSIERLYDAVVENQILESAGKWENLLVEDKNYKMHVTDNERNSKKAITHFSVVSSKNNRTWIQCKLETGRKNQIRAQAAFAGYPVVGDTKYGATTDPIQRLGLHASFLSFIHPTSLKKVKFSYPAPKSFTSLFN